MCSVGMFVHVQLQEDIIIITVKYLGSGIIRNDVDKDGRASKTAVMINCKSILPSLIEIVGQN